jgi:hypothetical protein
MNLIQLLDKNNVHREGHKCCCPFHSDRSPSAIINSWGIYCYTCVRSYKLWEIERLFGEIIDDRVFVPLEKDEKGVTPLFIL